MTKLWDTFLDLRRGLLSFALSYLGTEDAEDAVQVTASRIAGAATKKQISHEASFIWAVHRHTVIDCLRRRSRQKRELKRWASVAPAQETSDNIQDWELREDVRQALRALPPADRLALLFYFYHDLTLKETANLLGISVSSAHRRIKSAIGRLRDALATQGE